VSAPQQQQSPGWFVLTRDVASLTLPWLLIFKQAGIFFAAPASVSEPILWLAGAMLGVPGVAQILSLRFGAGTAPQQPEPASPGSSPGPSSTSTSGVDPA
jgi:hypothetical protein